MSPTVEPRGIYIIYRYTILFADKVSLALKSLKPSAKTGVLTRRNTRAYVEYCRMYVVSRDSGFRVLLHLLNGSTI
jgi:hypothetical protein